MNMEICDRCPMVDICKKEKESELAILRDKDGIRPRLDDYCPLRDIVVSNIQKQTWQLADIADKYYMYYGKENTK